MSSLTEYIDIDWRSDYSDYSTKTLCSTRKVYGCAGSVSALVLIFLFTQFFQEVTLLGRYGRPLEK